MNEGTKERFNQFDSKLREHCMHFPNHTVFFDSSKVFKYDGVIQAKFFEKDSIHANRASANLYASCLANFVKNHF